MRKQFKNILVIQTAFIGDAVLTLPLLQILRQNFTHAKIDVVVIPRTADLFANHPAITTIIPYDKRKTQKGVRGFLHLRKLLAENQYDLAIVPHRSLRSALLAKLSGIPFRIGFDKSEGRIFYTHNVFYDDRAHEIDRNVSLLKALEIQVPKNELPKLYPSKMDSVGVNEFLKKHDITAKKPFLAIAPGTIWNTKRWLPERYGEVAKKLSQKYQIVFIGGSEDFELCEIIKTESGIKTILNTAGSLSLLQSAELIRRCRLLISNDSAPMHIAVAVGTPVIAIFGATVPAFGFAPRGPRDKVIEIQDLKCRPCAIHGGEKCPINTFDCMKRIEAAEVIQSVEKLVKNIEG